MCIRGAFAAFPFSSIIAYGVEFVKFFYVCHEPKLFLDRYNLMVQHIQKKTGGIFLGIMFSTLKSQGQKYAGVYSVFLLLSVVVSVLLIVSTFFRGELSEAAVDGNQSELVRFLVILSVVLFVRAVASALSVLVLERFGARVRYAFRENFVKYFLQKPFSAFMETKSGESLSIFSNDRPWATHLVSSSGPRMIADIFALVVMVVYMFTVNWWLSLIFFATFPLLIVMQVLISVPIQKKMAAAQEAAANFTAVVNDSFQNASTVIAFSLEEVMKKRVSDSYSLIIEAWKKFIVSYASLTIAGLAFATAPIFIIVVVLAQQVIGGHMYFAEFVVFFGLAAEAARWLMALSQRQGDVKSSEAGAKRFVEHIDKSVEDLESGVELDKASPVAVYANNLCFKYGTEDDAPLVLDMVNFAIKKGSRVAFVGGSGSGKSTILKLLLRLYEPTGGELGVLGVKANQASLSSLRSAISYVPQDSFLFPETIAANISGYDSPPDMAKLEKAAADAGILDFIQSLPEKWNAVLGESAENISGGQKQRIALARALYKDAAIILFDEATSSLDPTIEAEIIKSLENLPKDKTLLIVAHRLKAIVFCDEIIVMDGGRVAGTGTHEKLLETNEVYRNLYKSQGEA